MSCARSPRGARTVAGALTLALLTPLAVGQERFVSAAGEHFRAICQFSSPEVASLALETAEAAWPIAAELYGVKEAPREPYRIHLLPDVDSYRRLEKRLTGGTFASNLAFSSWKTKESYIAMQPQRARGEEWPALPVLTRRLIAHEATHLVLYHSDPDFETVPAWLTEGIAELVADEVLRAQGWAESETADPYTASRIVWLRDRYYGNDRRSAQHLIETALQGHGGYALQGTLFSFLREQEGAVSLEEFLRRSRTIDRDPEVASKEFQTLFKGTFAPQGPAQMAALEDAFTTRLLASAPVWYEEGRSLERAPDGVGWVQIAFPDLPALAWRLDPRLSGVTRIRARIEIVRSSASHGATLYLGGRGRSGSEKRGAILAIDLDADHGVRLRVSSGSLYEAPPPWAEEGQGTDESQKSEGTLTCTSVRPPLATPFELVLRVDEGRCAIAIDGVPVLECPTDAYEASGRLGLGAPRGGLVRWRALDIERGR